MGTQPWLGFLQSPRSASHLTYTVAQTKAKDLLHKGLNALLSPETLLSGTVMVQPQGVGLSLPIWEHGWCGMEVKEGKKMPPGNCSLRVNCCLSEQPASQALKHVNIEPCAANQCKQYLLSPVW